MKYTKDGYTKCHGRVEKKGIILLYLVDIHGRGKIIKHENLRGCIQARGFINGHAEGDCGRSGRWGRLPGGGNDGQALRSMK